MLLPIGVTDILDAGYSSLKAHRGQTARNRLHHDERFFESDAMRQVNYFVVNNRLSCRVYVTPEEAEQGLDAFRDTVRTRHPECDIAHNGQVMHTKFEIAAGESCTEVYDWLYSAILNSFPSLREPETTYFVEHLGELVRDDELGWWEGKVVLDGSEVNIEIASEGMPEASRPVQVAVEHWPEWREKLHAAVVADLLQIYNDSWRPHDERCVLANLESSEFLVRLSPFLIHVDDKANLDIHFFPDGMFGDHDVMVSLTNGEIDGVNLIG
jgi:hypothetical protein